MPRSSPEVYVKNPSLKKEWELALVFLFVCALCAAYLMTRDSLALPRVFGHKTRSLFDLWSVQHFASGCVFGAFLCSRQSTVRWWRILFLVFLWEAVEWSLEAGGLGSSVAHWFGGEEHWANRLITDPLLGSSGCCVGLRWPRPRLFLPMVTVAWFSANLLSPDCMYLQERFLRAFSP